MLDLFQGYGVKKHPPGTHGVIRPPRSRTMRGFNQSKAPSAASLRPPPSAHPPPSSPGHRVTCMQSPNATKTGSMGGRKSSWYLAPLAVSWRPDKRDDGAGWPLLLRLRLTDDSCQDSMGPPAVLRSCQGSWAGSLSHHSEEELRRPATTGRLLTQNFIVIAQEQRHKMGNVKHKPRSQKNRQKALNR